MITMERAASVLDAAVDAWEDARADGLTVLGAGEWLDLARDCFDREDWTGAWLGAGAALGFLPPLDNPRKRHLVCT